MNENKIRVILVDDEQSAIDNLTILLEEYCPELEVVATADCVDDAVIKIAKHKPDAIFLDIEMPGKTGFELLEESKEQFQTVFVTAYDEYAIQAFDVSAVDYLLKPVDIKRLQRSVTKLQNREFNNVKILQENIQSKHLQKIIIPNTLGLEIINIKDIICIEANNSYSVVHYNDGAYKTQIFSKLLRYFEDITNNNSDFYRSQRSWLINVQKVRKWLKKDNKIILTDGVNASISRSKQKEFVELLQQKGIKL